jgi:competence ComEA-like helix-hairpin-helix protein
MSSTVPSKAPWRLLERDQVVLYALCVLVLLVAAARYAWHRWAPAKHVEVLAGQEPIRYRVDLNRADVAELDLLPGVGPAKAARIVEYRATHGPFTRGDDLAAVPGFSRACVERLKGLVTPDVEGVEGGASK